MCWESVGYLNCSQKITVTQHYSDNHSEMHILLQEHARVSKIMYGLLECVA